jgi:23S rRNA maturation-related 3'-5' exoribonuclease YhaM
LGESGLVRHTQCAVRIAHALFNITPFDDIDKDVIISALLLHDGLKSGFEYSGNTVHEHPNLMGDFIFNIKFNNIISDNIRLLISKAVKSHMGQWNVSKYSNVALEKPISKVQRFVHMCDYLASRKFLNMDLEE